MLGKRVAAPISAAIGITLAVMSGSAAADEDSRELVDLPPMMQQHMLANMRDHLAALDAILAALAEGNIEAASSIAEERLGMSSLTLHGAAHLSQFMPQAMADIGTQMHRAASRFVIVAQDAELNPGREAQREVYRALQEITRNCNACHQSYRIR
jgi:cytochrome c556